jgi:Tfp pilus assembly protein PilN
VSSALVIAVPVAPALVALPIVIGVAVVLFALVALGGMRQRQKRFSERRANAGQLRTGAEERTERAEHDRDSARERAERARGIDQDS